MSQAIETTTVELEITIQAPRDRVWRALTDEMNAWWLGDFRMVDPQSVVSLEPRAGGQMIEQKPGGGSLLWFTVTLVVPGQSLHMIGHISPGWGGPAFSMLSIELEGTGEVTTLKLSDALVGPLKMTTNDNLAAGWQALFGDGLKAHCER